MNILHLEDNPDDALLIQMQIKNSDLNCNVIWVDTKEKFESTLLNTKIDLVLCDYTLPNYNGIVAIEYMHKHKPDLPFILISGTIGEERTIEIFSLGATDFILKDNLQRLIPSLERTFKAVEETKKRKLAEDALQRSNEELLQFVHIASHDLKAPMIAIDRLASWIEEDATDRLSIESKKHLSLLRQRVNRMFNLIDAIIQYSQASRVNTDAQLVDTKKILDDVVDTLNPPETFVIKYTGNFPSLQTSAGLLNLVFSNLIANSLKHHHQTTGSITVNVEDTGDFYTFCVIDDGPGIAKEYHDKIFQMFQTLEPRDVLDTTGMGLSIVKKIVESRGGRVGLDSEKGNGSKFCFTWLKNDNM